jgi:O-antigen/teichoic acid export membrane protein
MVGLAANGESDDSAAAGRTLHGIAYGVVVGALSLLSGILLLPIVANQVGPGAYGVWLFLISITTYVGYGDLGVTSAIIHFGARSRGGDGTYTLSALLSAGLVWSMASMVVVLPLYLWLAFAYTEAHLGDLGDSGTSQIALVALGATIAFMAVVRPFFGALVSAGLMVWTQRIAFLALIFRVAGTLAAVYLFGTITAVAIVETVATVMPGIVVMVLVLKRVASVRFTRGMWPTLKLMLAYSTKSLTMGLSESVVLQGGTLIVGVVLGPSSVTHFNLAYRVYNGVRQLVDWILEPFRSTLSRIAVGSRGAHRRMIETLSFATMTAIVAVTIVWLLGSRFLVERWVGEYMPAAEIAAVAAFLLAGMTIETLHSPWVMAADTIGKPGAFLLPQILWACLSVPLGLYLAGRWGIVGVAIGMASPLLVLEPLYLRIARQAAGMHLHMWWRRSLAPVVVATALPVAAAMMTWVAASAAAPSLAAWLPTVVFVVSWFLSVYLVRRLLPLDDVMSALRSRM